MSTEDPKAPERFSLSRWSRRKREAVRGASAAPGPAAAASASPVAAQAPAAVASGDAAVPFTQAAATATATAPASAAPAAADALPPVDSLTFDSDFAAFMQPKVDESTKRAALKKLFSNEHFNVMDGLDIYVGDYTQPDPMPEGMLDKLASVYEAIKPFDNVPPATDVTPAQPVANGGPIDAPTGDTAERAAAPETPPDAGAPALPAVAADELVLPAEATGETTTAGGACAPAVAPKSA